MQECPCVKCQLRWLAGNVRRAMAVQSPVEVAVAAIALGAAVLATITEPSEHYRGCGGSDFPSVWSFAWGEFAEAYVWLERTTGLRLDSDQSWLLNLLAYRLGLSEKKPEGNDNPEDEGGV